MLKTAESARKFYESDDRQNSGGDRTWLAPEVDIFFPQFPELDLSTYWQPTQLDPGNYQVVREDGVVPAGKPVVEMPKWVGPAANPLRYEREWEFAREVQ